MAYDPTIPAAANTVRGASGDLVKMKTNFAHLDPVATSGLHGLISGGASVASGQVAVTQGGAGSAWHYRANTVANLNDTTIAGATSGQALTWNGSAWVNATPVSTLSGLSDVTIASPTSGQALTYDGAGGWENATPVSTLAGLTDTTISAPTSGQALVYNGSAWVNASGVARDSARALKLTDSTGVGTGSWVTVTGLQAIADGSELVSVSSGILISGNIAKVDIMGQAALGASVNQVIHARIALDGVPLSSGSYGIDIQTTIDTGTNTAPIIWIGGLGVPVTSGETLELQVQFDGGATQNILSGVDTFLFVQDNAQAPGGGSGGGVPAKRAILSLASGATFSTTQNTDHLLSGLISREAVGVAVNAAGGIIEVPSGVTHVKLHGQVRWASNASADRRAWFLFGSDARPLGDTDPRVGCFSIIQAVNGTNTIQQLSSEWLPVTAGTQIKLYVRQGGSATLNVEAGYAIGGTGPVAQTYWSAQFV